MGSEHYCLRWNNHQSNLLGVFSQLLQDESLVDVTLACSEGAPIRAHKVVLSACSSYFQSLFLDHPEKHPIVILKDVRSAELQTLVEFMYKGEVNVQYCQLSALLKTAESLKVKGLAEMTNQNATLREPEREPERLRPHSQPCKRSNSCDSPVDATISGPSTSAATLGAGTAPPISSAQHAAALAAASALTIATNTASSTSATVNTTSCTIASSATSSTSFASYSSQHASSVSSKREHPSERCSPSPPKRLHAKHEQDSPLPLDLYQRRLEQHQHQQHQHQQQQQEDTKENAIVNNNNTNEKHKSTTAYTASGTTYSNNSDGSSGGGNVSVEEAKKREVSERDSIRSFNSPDILARHDLNRPLDETMAAEGISGISAATGSIEKIEDVEDAEYGDEEMELDDDGDNTSEDVCLNMKIRSSSLAAALVSPQLTSHRGLESSGHGSGIGSGGGDCGADSARSTPLATTLPLSYDTHSQRPASRSSREGSGLDRPSSRGGLSGMPSTSASALAGSLSPALTPTTALGLHSDSIPGSSGLGPVQSVPLSLKKEIDCSEDDNSNSRHHLQPRSASASGVLGGDLEYRIPHESETSDSPHGLGSIANTVGGSGSGSGVGSGSLGGSCSTTTGNTASTYVHEQPQTPPPYTCVYCGAGFPNQNKLTRHILSHSLKTLEYRETATHALLHPHLLAHDLNMSPLAYQMNAAMASASGDAQEQAAAVAAAVAMDMDFAAAIAAAGGCPFPSLASCTTRGVDLDGSGGGGSSSSGRGGRDSGGGGTSSASGNGGCPSSSFSLLSSASSSTSAAAAAAVAAAAASSSASSTDPNSVVLCKFCGKSFPDVTSLITHLPIHTGDRPFKCEFCGKAFKLRHHMKDHCRVHTGERPFRCQMCGKTFSRSTILKAHEKTHFPKYARKFLSPSPVDTKDELPQ